MSEGARRIAEYFTAELPSRVFNLVFLDRRRWEGVDFPLDHLHQPFGYTAPRRDTTSGLDGDEAGYWVFVCPEIVAETTEPLAGPEVEELYLKAVSLHLMGHVAHGEAPSDQMEARIDNDMWALEPALLVVMSDVMMCYLDQRARQG